jgi:hypothetical protein
VVQYATATELAGYLGQDVDTYTADQALTLASGSFSQAAATWFASQSVTYTTTGTEAVGIRLPFRPVIAVSEVRINGDAVTGWTLVKSTVWRTAGFGTSCVIPPDEVEIDLTHGYTTVPDDVKAAVLETAAAAYSQPVGAVLREQIDDYQVAYSASGGGIQLTASAKDLAASYRGTFAA